MRIAVLGGTGVVGHHTVEALRRAGHDIAVVARSHGVNVATGEGLDDALVGIEAVIDVTALQGPNAEATQNLFGAAMKNLLAAEQRVSVRHHVLLSIVGVDRIEGNAHYAGKRIPTFRAVQPVAAFAFFFGSPGCYHGEAFELHDVDSLGRLK